MPEILKISGLGPIKNLKIEVKPLTVLVGPQASGKSLAAQVLYFFRTLRSELARKYTPDMDSAKSWQNEVVRKILDELRGEPFGYFANKTAKIGYENAEEGKYWSVNISEKDRLVTANQELKNHMSWMLEDWKRNSDVLSNERIANTIFIPTERTLLTKFLEKEPSILYSESQPLPFRRFADFLTTSRIGYRINLINEGKIWKTSPVFDYVLNSQRRALQGEAFIPENQKLWKFRIKQGEETKILPLSVLASGQMEAWPFFAVAATWGTSGNTFPHTFFFEEPETHLHPAAQRIIVETIAYLVNKHCPFFITTHSPYILYTINNLMQAHISYGGKVPEGAAYLDPKDVAAYRLTADGKAVSIIDKKTGMLDSDEVDATSNQLGREFDALLDLEEGRG